MKNQHGLPHLLIFGLLFLSACRFGNYSDSPTQNNGSLFSHSELFFTQITGFETHVFFTDGTESSNTSSPLVAVPSNILNTFTNPVYWNIVNNSDHENVFWDVFQSDNALYVFNGVDANGHINETNYNPGPGENDGATFYKNPACGTNITTILTGSLDRSTPGTTVLPGSHVNTTVSGHLGLDIDWAQRIEGDCVDDLQELVNCFQNGSGCDTNQLAAAKIFALYVNGTGVLHIQDATRIKKLEYIVHLQ